MVMQPARWESEGELLWLLSGVWLEGLRVCLWFLCQGKGGWNRLVGKTVMEGGKLWFSDFCFYFKSKGRRNDPGEKVMAACVRPKEKEAGVWGKIN